MASASSAPRSPPSAPNSETSATQPTSALATKFEVATDNGVNDVFEEKLDSAIYQEKERPDSAIYQEKEKPDSAQHFEVLDSEDHIEKYKKYEAEYSHRLMAKYFSKNNIYGGNIFEGKMKIDDETIMSSRWPCTRSFADPKQGFEDQSSNGSTSTAEPSTNISNGSPLPKNV